MSQRKIFKQKKALTHIQPASSAIKIIAKTFATHAMLLAGSMGALAQTGGNTATETRTKTEVRTKSWTP